MKKVVFLAMVAATMLSLAIPSIGLGDDGEASLWPQEINCMMQVGDICVPQPKPWCLLQSCTMEQE